MKSKVETRKDELLVELNKNVPQIEWEFKEIKEEKRYLNGGTTLEGFDIYFNGTHKESKDDCYIKFDNGRLDVLELGYYHMGNNQVYNGKNKNYKHISDWDGVNEFFNEYCIGLEGREEKIKSGEMVTPNMLEMKNVGTYKMSQNEYSQGLLHLLLPHPIKYFSGKTDIDHINQSFLDFEKEYKELKKELNSDNDYDYFGNPSEMVLSFLESKLSGEIEHYLGEVMNEVEKELKKEHLETIKN
ncbi:MAG: hypothetical protein ISQ95_01080 [Flavobacteriales bacterium]|nr:hypothetical protein [Flavobacteriales bacterium]